MQESAVKVLGADVSQVLVRRNIVEIANLVEDAGTEIKKLIYLHFVVFSFSGYEFVDVLSVEIHVDQIKYFFMHYSLHRLFDPPHHVQYQVPVFMPNLYKRFVTCFFAQCLVHALVLFAR